MFTLLFNYTKLFGWLTMYKYYKNDIILSLIVNNIHKCGCVTIKLTQWMLPLLELSDNKDHCDELWFQELETVYENCNKHSIEHTIQTYYDCFQRNFLDDYEINSVIASGSIGQVLKVFSKKDKKWYAMKVIHPDLKKQIYFLKIILYLLYNLPIIKKYIIGVFPFNIEQFINDFEKQINLINDGNNMLQFYENYENNSYIIIPKLHVISNDILIMSYENGLCFDKLKCNEYIKYKSILLLQLFIKNNQLILNLNHGDIHKGNWKVRIVNNEPMLVIYDYGICWGLLNKDRDMLEFIDNTFSKMDDGIECYEELLLIVRFLLGDKCSKETIMNKFPKINIISNPDKLLEIIINIAKKEYIVLNSLLINVLIFMIQVTKYFKKYGFIKSDENYKKGFTNYEYIRKRLLDIYCFIKTKNIFHGYQTYLEKKLTDENVSVNELFETIETENNFKQYNFNI
jgi:hypothetical protein